MNLKVLLLIHSVLTFAAGIVLIFAPELIPGAVGIQVSKDFYLVCYLLAASELSVATLSFLGRNIQDVKALQVIILSCIVLHATSALLEIYAFVQGLSSAVWGNVALRILVVILFWYYGFYKKARAKKA